MYTSLTVGIPFYAKTKIDQLKAAINSILSQTLVPDEIHLIQDGIVSEDLASFVKHYIDTFSHVKHILIDSNSGLAHALNVSILSTNSKYYARMDSDDISHPQRLEKQVKFLEANPNVDILGTWSLEFEADHTTESCFLRKVPTNQFEMKKIFHYRNPFIHPTVMFRRIVFAKIGLYNPVFRLEEDLELWSRALKMQIKVANLPEALLYYRFTGSISRRAYALPYQVKARYQYNTWSIQLNILKLLSLLMRILPLTIQKWAYQYLRT